MLAKDGERVKEARPLELCRYRGEASATFSLEKLSE